MQKITLLLTIGMTFASVLDTTERANAGSLPGCWWPGDLDGSTGAPDLGDFAVLQRCFGLSVPAPECSPDEFWRTDLRADGVIDLLDYNAFAAMGWPPIMSIDCGFVGPFGDFVDRCGAECLPDGEPVDTGTAIIVTPRWSPPVEGAGVREIRVARDADRLASLVDPTPLGNVDFETHEVIIFTTTAAVENGCWGAAHCYNGTVDLLDGRRAVSIGFVQHGPLLCFVEPWTVTTAVVTPRSERPVVMLFIEWDGQVTQTGTPLCE